MDGAASLVASLAAEIRQSRALAHKADIGLVTSRFGIGVPRGSQSVRVGDDCAAIPDGDGFLLFAIEGFLDSFVSAMPWFAGYCGVMVNLGDIAAMGGRPIAVVDAIWSRDQAQAAPMLDGLSVASTRYGVPIVGGHSNLRSDGEQLSVAVLGRASRLLTSFDAQPGQVLIAAIDLRGAYHDPYPFWDASTRGASRERLRGDLDILPELAEAGLCGVAKDISNGGLPGTALMLAECSGIGFSIELDRIPRPEGADLGRWLTAFPSFGFLLSVAPRDAPAVMARFAARGIATAAIGTCEAGTRLDLIQHGRRETCWDHSIMPLLGCGGIAA